MTTALTQAPRTPSKTLLDFPLALDLVEITASYDHGHITITHAERLICNFIGACVRAITTKGKSIIESREGLKGSGFQTEAQ